MLSPDEFIPQEARDRAVAHWERAVRPELVAFGRTLDGVKPKINEAPPGLSEDERKAWYAARADKLVVGPLPTLSAKARELLSRSSYDTGGALDASLGPPV